MKALGVMERAARKYRSDFKVDLKSERELVTDHVANIVPLVSGLPRNGSDYRGEKFSPFKRDNGKILEVLKRGKSGF